MCKGSIIILKGEKKQLTAEKGCNKINTNKRWIMCPICGRGKVLCILPTTRVSNLPVYCKLCRNESIVNIPRA